MTDDWLCDYLLKTDALAVEMRVAMDVLSGKELVQLVDALRAEVRRVTALKIEEASNEQD